MWGPWQAEIADSKRRLHSFGKACIFMQLYETVLRGKKRLRCLTTQNLGGFRRIKSRPPSSASREPSQDGRSLTCHRLAVLSNAGSF